MKVFLRILAYAKPFQRFAIPYFIFALLSILFGLLNYSFLMPTLDLLFDANNVQMGNSNVFRENIEPFVKALMNDHGKSGALIGICLVLVVSNLLTNFFKFFSLRIVNGFKAELVSKLRNHVYGKITSLHVGYFSDEKKGDLMSKMSNDVMEIEATTVNTLPVFLRDPFQIIIYFGVLFVLSWKLTLISLLILPFSGAMISLIARKLKKQSRQGQSALGFILSIVDETTSGMRVITAFNAQKFLNRKFENENKKYADLLVSMSNKRDLSSPLSEFMGITVVAVLLFIGGTMVFNKELTASEFFFYIISFYQILTPAKSISSSITNIQRGVVAGERIFHVIDAKALVEDAPQAKQLKVFDKGIQFEEVSFAYNDEYVLKKVNLTVPKGKTIALVGPSGGGKSTLADLIPRFWDPKEGVVKIDGVDIKSFTQDSLRAKMSVVTQESILFNDTIFNNIAFGNESATMDEVIAAAKVANAHDFIVQSDEGYQTVIGERGSKLSGGQRQRLSIARAVLKNPDILILDEATSALDNESERLVQSALQKLMEGRTSVVIAHRLSTIQHADEIVVLQKGVIVERGSHEKLLSLNGVYKSLQASAY